MTDETRQTVEFSLLTEDRGKITLKIFDRITVDDVFLHLVNQEIFRIVTKQDSDTSVPYLFKDFLLKERFTAGQN